MSLHDLQSRRTAGFPGLESASPDHGPLPPSSAEKPIIKRLFARLLKLQVETGDELDLKSVYASLL